MRLLIVDDSRVMRQIVIRTLRQAGHGDHDIVEADNGRTALAAVAEHQPDLILSDWNMPEMSGIDFLKALRASGDRTPFGFVTSEGSPTMREQALAAGARFLIAKPFTADVFADHLDGIDGGARKDDDAAEDAAAPTDVRLPSRKAVRDLLEGLLNKACPIADGLPVTAHRGAGDVTVGEILADDGRLAAVLLADRHFAVKAGACLSLVTPSGAEDILADGTVPAQVRSAFAEVLNVLSALFNVGTAEHVRLGRVWVGSEQVPPAVASAAREMGAREDLTITMAGYGPGMLSLVLA